VGGTLVRPKTLVRIGAVVAAVLAVVLPAVVALRALDDDARVRIEPSDGLLDAPLRLQVDGIEDGSPLRLTLSATSGEEVRWEGTQTVTGERRSIDLGPLLASLRPTGRLADARDVALMPPEDGLELRLEARQGGDVVGTATAMRRMAASEVSATQLTVAADGLAGRLWTPAQDDRRPVAVLSLGGSEGGYGSDWVERLVASHGYPVLQLAYFDAEGLPNELSEIPLEYFASALQRLRAENGVERVVVLGFSRGAELALILGSRFAGLVDGVVAYAPSSVVNPSLDCGPAWTLRGAPLPTVDCSEYGNASPSNGEAVIAVERIDGPVMAVAGVSDSVWPAASYAAAIESRLEEHERSEVTVAVFPAAGHGVVAAIPYLPNAIGDADLPETRRADALARTETWPRLLALLERLSAD
jgi:dienelactone hydrolase